LNRKREQFADSETTDTSSTGVNDKDDDNDETDDESNDDDDDDDDDDNEIDENVPGLQERDAYDSDSDDEEEDEDINVDADDDDDDDEQSAGVHADDNDDEDEQSAGVHDDKSTGVDVETVEEEEADSIPVPQTKGIPKRNTTTRTSRRVKQSHFHGDFVYTNYSSSLTMSQSHITRTIEHVHAMHALVNYGQVMTPGIKTS
jgi:hypothetical protein